jgi:hypothetical protein
MPIERPPVRAGGCVTSEPRTTRDVEEVGFPEQFVYVRSDDDVVNGGAMFAPPEESANQIAVLWIHGWGANFYSPTYDDRTRLG